VKTRKLQAAAAILGVVTATLMVSASAKADDTRNDQWHLRYLRITEAHRITQGEGVTVAVIDTGVDPHPDLRQNLLSGTTVVPGDHGNGQTDGNGHGTNMAGIIAAHGRGGDRGVLGIAPKARVLPIKDAKPGYNGNGITVAAGIEWAASHGAKVLNISSAIGPTLALDHAIALAAQKDIVVVAGSGNKGTNILFGYPAAIPGVLAVGAIDRAGKLAKLTVTGKPMGICAPGVGIISTGRNRRYIETSGTSDSTAIVSGAAALVRSKFPDLSAPEVIHRLTATATDIGKPGRDNECGFGVLNVVKALTADVPPLGAATTAPAPTASATIPGPRPPTGADNGNAAGEPTPTGTNTAALVGGSVIVLLFGGLIAFLVIRRRKVGPTT
jgi:type VII secretion-associated serine protease mycosin